MGDSNDIQFNEYSVDFFTFLNYLFERLFSGNTGGGEVAVGGWTPADVINLISTLWGVFVVLSWIFSALCIAGLIYAYIRGEQIGEVFGEILAEQEEKYDEVHNHHEKNGRWKEVLQHIESERVNDWKLAIIEADILLEELLEKEGYPGVTVGDKLKGASPDSFSTVNQAWRAHTVRNRIAHEGADFELSQKEAQETITQYKMVFEEFGAI